MGGAAKPKLVIGANGFLGSHVTRQLVADGNEVRAMVRPTANTRAIDDLQVTRFEGDVFDTDTLREAMDGVDDVYHCVVDARAWLRDPSPLFRTNVEGLRNVLDVAVKQPDLHRFIFTSTYATVGRRHGHVATEDDVIGSRGLTPYVQSRVQAENLVMQYVAELRPARRRNVRFDDLRQRRLGPHPARRLHRRRGLRQAAVRDERHPAGSRRRRRCRPGDDSGRRTRTHRRALPRLRKDDRDKGCGADRGRRGRRSAAGTLDLGASAVRAGRAGQPESPAHRQRHRTQPQIGADDARRGRRGPQQGGPRAGLAAAAGRGFDSRGRPVLGRDAHEEEQPGRRQPE